MTTETIEPTLVEKYPYRHLIAHLKRLVKDDAASIREEKAYVRTAQRAGDSASAQSTLAISRRTARARQVIYALTRGHTWAQVENNHPNGDPVLAFALKSLWVAVNKGLEGGEVEMPASLRAHLEDFK